MKNCYKFKSLISNYIDKEISFRDRKFFESHKNECSSCQSLYTSVFSMKQRLGSLTSVETSNQFMESLRNKILKDRNSRILASQNKGFSFRQIPAFAYGFSSLMILVIAGFIYLQMPVNATNQEQQIPIAAQEKINNAKTTFQQQFDATPAHLPEETLAKAKADSGKSVQGDNVRNFENNMNKVDYQKK
ncbi:MAG: zf-HC2 domain-containing protein [Candidatus Marinimicrobia bacterium]|nr:zf-HC2 domain-containing protein [Candidatus Neomarinimicrobiota bacterium]